MSKLDLAASECIKLNILIKSSAAVTAVTHKADFIFHKPTYMGDIIQIVSKIDSLGKKSIAIITKAYRIYCAKDKNKENLLVAEAEFVFVTKDKDDNYVYHGVT